jgi:hypothetical protein
MKKVLAMAAVAVAIASPAFAKTKHHTAASTGAYASARHSTDARAAASERSMSSFESAPEWVPPTQTLW